MRLCMDNKDTTKAVFITVTIRKEPFLKSEYIRDYLRQQVNSSKVSSAVNFKYIYVVLFV
jgi:hypothetical protein